MSGGSDLHMEVTSFWKWVQVSSWRFSSGVIPQVGLACSDAARKGATKNDTVVIFAFFFFERHGLLKISIIHSKAGTPRKRWGPTSAYLFQGSHPKQSIHQVSSNREPEGQSFSFTQWPPFHSFCGPRYSSPSICALPLPHWENISSPPHPRMRLHFLASLATRCVSHTCEYILANWI